MKFNINVTYLGMKPNTLKDGSVYYTCSFFNMETQTPISLNCGEKSPVAVKLNAMDFMSPCTVTVEFVASKEKPNHFKIALRDVK